MLPFTPGRQHIANLEAPFQASSVTKHAFFTDTYNKCCICQGNIWYHSVECMMEIVVDERQKIARISEFLFYYYFFLFFIVFRLIHHMLNIPSTMTKVFHDNIHCIYSPLRLKDNEVVDVITVILLLGSNSKIYATLSFAIRSYFIYEDKYLIWFLLVPKVV